MPESSLLHELIGVTAERSSHARALTSGSSSWSYAELYENVRRCAAGLVRRGLARGDRVGIYLEKRFETVVASFGAAAAGCTFVPINPILKPEQVAYIVRDCDVRVLVTTADRHAVLEPQLTQCPSIVHVVLTEPDAAATRASRVLAWSELLDGAQTACHRVIDVDMAAILYTSGSTGRPSPSQLHSHP